MHYRALGTSDVKVSEISLGCWTMGGLNWVNGTANGWANVNEDEITAAIKGEKFKVSASLQDRQVRVTGTKRDELQEVIAFLREKDFGVSLSFKNFRD